MRLTNKYGVPDTIVRATHKHQAAYDKGAVDRSVTGLIKAPQIDILRKRHFAEMESDVADEFWMLLGSAVHSILQMGASSNQIVEERLFAEFDGWTISGAMDVQNIVQTVTATGIHIEDYKVTSTFQVMMNNGDAKLEWEQQLNVYRWLVETVKKTPVTRLSIIVIMRDWARTQTGDPLYPPAAIQRLDVPIWPIERVEAYLHERINAHRRAELAADLGLDLPPCTVEDRWGRGGLWKIYKVGGKRAVKTVDTMDEADRLVAEMGDAYEARQTAYKYIRCEGNYCGVAQWCKQWAKDKERVPQQPRPEALDV
jgi:hypothetical protein